VTDAVSDLGREFALLLVSAGAKVAALDINQASLDSVASKAKSMSGNIRVHRANVAR